MVIAEAVGGTQLVHGKLGVGFDRDHVEVGSSLTTCVHREAFECNQCMECFQDRDALFKHVKMAHKQHVHARRKFKCEQCQKTFKSMTGLRNHARTHSIYFEANTDRRLSISILSETTATNPPCTMDSTFTVETDYINMNEEAGVSVKVNGNYSDDPGSRDSCHDSGSTNKGSGRRRSGIPLPVRRSLLQADNRFLNSGFSPDRESPNELNDFTEQESTEQYNGKLELAGTSKERRMTRESRRLTRVIPKEVIGEINKNVKRGSRKPNTCTRTPEPKAKTVTNAKLQHNSPFGTKYRTKFGSPVTPRGRSQSNKRTAHKGKRSPKYATPSKEGITLIGEKGTPICSRTPGSRSKTPSRQKYNCKKCGKSFVDNAKLEVHFAVHIRDTPEKCGIPKYALKKTPNAKKTDGPLVKPCTTVDESFSCTLCGRSYALKKYLDAHMKIHDVNTPYSCDFCDKKFRFLSSLKAHSFVHQGEESRDNISESKNRTSPKRSTRDLNCSETSRKFNIFSILSTYENPLDDLLNEPPFTCKMCSFKTRAPSDLLSHMKSHSNTGRFTCMHCSKSYKLQSNLKLHEKIHTISRLKQILIDGRNNKTVE